MLTTVDLAVLRWRLLGVVHLKGRRVVLLWGLLVAVDGMHAAGAACRGRRGRLRQIGYVGYVCVF